MRHLHTCDSDYLDDCGRFESSTMSHIFVSTRQMVSNYIPVTQPTATALVLVAVPLLYIIVRRVLTYLSAPIRELPGPKSVKWLTGSLDRSVWEPDAQDRQMEWTLKYGPVFRYYGFFNVSVIYGIDINKSKHPIFTDTHYRCYEPPSGEPYFQCSRIRKDLCGSSGLGSDRWKRLVQFHWNLQRLKFVVVFRFVILRRYVCLTCIHFYG